MPVEVKGYDLVSANLAQLVAQSPKLAGLALRSEAEIEMTEAKRRVPVKTGALRGTGHVVPPAVEGGQIVVKLQFGGPAVDYALEIHENLEMFHPRGGQAKYLESVVKESAPYLAQRVATRLARRLAAYKTGGEE